jgi:hypothetical protein
MKNRRQALSDAHVSILVRHTGTARARSLPARLWRDALLRLPLTRLLEFPYRLPGRVFDDDESAARLVETY